jgi:Ca2+-binding EF-hand superfamily protein
MVRLSVVRRNRRRPLLMVVLAGLTAIADGAAHAGEAGSGRLMERLFHKMDTDGDGAISAAEGEAAAEEMFDRRDANGDGVLTESEFTAEAGGKQLVADQRQKLDARRAKRFAAMDKDGDGKVSAQEFFAAAQQRFTAADANGDGRVTKEELRSLKDALYPRRPLSRRASLSPPLSRG